MEDFLTASRRKKQTTLEREFPGAAFIDVTSKGPEPWVRFSPFWPHRKIPVPLHAGKTGACVEAIWQALKVFETAPADFRMLTNDTMKNIKRTVRRFGTCLGHQGTTELLTYVKARKQIYLPAYHWVLTHCLTEELWQLRALAENGPVVLLDYETNGHIEDTSRPLSHASLIAAWLNKGLAG